jgi:SRSO17 transposase
MEHFQDPGAIGVIDETGFIKKGKKSVGVQRQYSGTAGKIENCQIGVFLNYVAPKGKAFIDRELYLPQGWARDQERRREAGVPENIKFATKPELACRMLQRALEAGLFFGWITADTVYGNSWQLRHWLEKENQPYVLAISSNRCVWGQDRSQWRIKRLAAKIADSAWQRLSVGEGSKGLRIYDWAWLKLPDIGTVLPKGWSQWLLVRRSVEKPEEMAYYLAAGPENTTLVTLAEVAGKRWAIEVSFEEAKGEAGLDEYEVRKWESWYRHITLSLLAHAYLAVCRACKNEKGAIIS